MCPLTNRFGFGLLAVVRIVMEKDGGGRRTNGKLFSKILMQIYKYAHIDILLQVTGYR